MIRCRFSISREPAPDLELSVGVAGFEPTASSSRIRLGTPDDLEIWQCALVRALVLVGPPQSAEVVLSMFAPHLLPEPTSVVPDMRRDHGS